MQAIEVLVALANLQTAFYTLDNALKVTNRRVNALENVVKPKLENTISYIKGELDELEREEFFRLKKVQKNNQQKQKALQQQVQADILVGYILLLHAYCHLQHANTARVVVATMRLHMILAYITSGCSCVSIMCATP